MIHGENGLGDVVAQYNIDGDAPMRMLLSNGKEFLLLAMGFGGLLRVDMVLTAEPPTFTSHEGLHTLTTKITSQLYFLISDLNRL